MTTHAGKHGGGESATGRPSRGLLLAALLVGTWAVLPPFVGPGFTTAGLDVEIVDHPLPALAVLAVAAWAARVRRPDETRLFVGGLIIALAGIWMTAAHAPLVVQAVQGQVRWTAAIHHTLPGLATLLLGGIWSWRLW